MKDTTTKGVSSTSVPVGFHLIDPATEAVRVANLQTAFYANTGQEYEEAINYFLRIGSGYGTEVVNLGAAK